MPSSLAAPPSDLAEYLSGFRSAVADIAGTVTVVRVRPVTIAESGGMMSAKGQHHLSKLN
ncbi:protein of unknown function (plasmid) [Cupriavidus taiwanensis]|nr:protein of unknown function [Cupriavidus taiwanensis]